MRLAILTFHRSYNCGAVLQAWALKTVLERMGHQVEFPDCGYPPGVRRFRCLEYWNGWSVAALKKFFGAILVDLFSLGVCDLLRWRYRCFVRRHLKERVCREADFAQIYDAIVVGSDQVWRIKLAKLRAPLFLGENIPDSVPKIGYAISVGDEVPSEQEWQRILLAAKRFSFVSTRERSLGNEMSLRLGCCVPVVLDPTLLLCARDCDAIAINNPSRRPYIFAYLVEGGPVILEICRKIANAMGLDLVMTLVYQNSLYCAPRGLTYGVSPERMIGYIRGAEYVLAASFHGTALALLHHKSFLSFREKKDKIESRPGSLLKQIGIGERLVDPSVSIEEMLRRIVSPLPDSAYVKLSQLRACSLDRLKKALEHIGAEL